MGTLTVFVLFLAFLWSCASVPVGIPRETQAIVDCAKDQECYIVQISSHAWLQAAIYVNGNRLTAVEGMGEMVVPLRRSFLDGGRCAQVFVKLLAGDGILLERQCIKPGGHFTLEIFDHLPNTVFTAWK